MNEGLRERKKQETRQEISNVATLMFIQRGFEKVTIADIAAAAGVAKMTVTNHFPRKEDLALDLHEEIRTSLAGVVARRAVGESAYTAIRRDYFEALERRDPLLGFSGLPFATLIKDSPTLQARLRELQEQREEALAEELAAGERPDAVARLVAAQLNAVHRVLFTEVFERTLAGEDDDQIATAVGDSAQRAFDLLQPSIGRYATRA